MKQDELVATNVRLPKTHLKALKQEALRREKSVNYLLRQLIERYLHTTLFGTDKEKERPIRSVWDFPHIARRTGDRRLAEKIDSIVYGAK